MTKNVGNIDARMRVWLAVGFLFLFLVAILNSRPLLAIPLALVGLAFLGTALAGMCPLYSLLGISTNDPRPGGT
jgi:hypothetical protein